MIFCSHYVHLVLHHLYLILFHTEKNWNITLPGFGGDEIKGFRKPVSID